MAKKRKASLPRVTLMAYRRQDLVAFVQAVETLRLLVDDLRIITEAAKKPAVKKPAVKKPAADVTDELLNRLIPRNS